MKAEVETISPEKAKQMMLDNTDNRPVNEDNVNFLVKEIKSGNWKVTGDTIKIGRSRRIIDGQHRLLAIIRANQSIRSLVARGVDDDTFSVIDIGKNRTAGDVLAIEKVEHPKRIASIVKAILTMKHGRYSSNSSKRARISNTDISEFVHKNKESLFHSYPYGYNRMNKLVGASALSALHFIFKKHNVEQAHLFCTRLADGAGLSHSSPIYVLRERLIADSQNKRKMREHERVAITIKAWNAFRSDKRISRVTWNDKKEDYPKPI